MKELFEESIKTIEPEAKPANKKMTIISFIIITVILIGLLIYMFYVDGLDNIVILMQNVDYRWVIAGLGCLFSVWGCEAINVHLPLKRLYPKQKFFGSFRISMIGQLFNNITPFNSGGQPMQVYELTKEGKRASDGFSALAMKFIISQTALLLFTVVVFLVEFNYFIHLIQNFFVIAIISMIINVLAILIVFISGINKNIIFTIAKPIIRFLGKIHFIKETEKTILKMEGSITNFSNQFKVMKSEKIVVLKMFLVSIVQWLFYYSITYMVYRAFGNSGLSFWQIIPSQAFLLLIMTFIPTPGSGIGAEGGFLLFFNSIFKNGTINMSILFWRIYTFYLPILIGSLFMIPNKQKKTSKGKLK